MNGHSPGRLGPPRSRRVFGVRGYRGTMSVGASRRGRFAHFVLVLRFARSTGTRLRALRIGIPGGAVVIPDNARGAEETARAERASVLRLKQASESVVLPRPS